MQHHGTCLLLQMPDFLLSDAVLEVCIDSAVRDALSLELAIIDKAIICKSAIVGMIMFDWHAHLS